MPDYTICLLIGGIVFLTHYQEGITGFGCSVLALPFVTMLVGLQMAVPVLVILGWLIAIGIVLLDKRGIEWNEFGIIVVLAGIGLPVGMWASGSLPENTLKWVLAVFMILVGIHGVIRQGLRYTPPKEMTLRRRLMLSVFVPMGGIMQGAFASGGPLVVIYGTRAMPNKSVFRGTLCIVWIVTNAIMIGRFAIKGALTPDVLRLTGICVPFVLAGMLLGNRSHYRVNEVMFRRIVYGVLIAAGSALMTQLLKHS